MPTTVKAFLETIGKKAGLSGNAEFKTLLEDPKLAEVEVSDQVKNLFDAAALMNKTEAENSAELQAHFIGKFTPGVNQRLEEELKAKGWSKERIDKAMAGKNHTDRLVAILEDFQTELADAKKAGNKADVKELTDQVAKAQLEVKAAKEGFEAQIGEVNSKWAKKFQSAWETTQLAGIQWDASILPELRTASAQVLMNNKLTELGGVAVFDPETETMKIMQAANPTLPLVRDGKEFGYKDLQSLSLTPLLDKGTGGSGPKPGDKDYRAPQNGGGGGANLTSLQAQRLSQLDKIQEGINRE